ncbi:MAG: hypothetical protein M1833_003805 [Piccolia ochrophora]|nr:MAG: hypothetical protein M1833_003805 [Piccolia ochrophora]
MAVQVAPLQMDGASDNGDLHPFFTRRHDVRSNHSRVFLHTDASTSPARNRRSSQELPQEDSLERLGGQSDSTAPSPDGRSRGHDKQASMKAYDAEDKVEDRHERDKSEATSHGRKETMVGNGRSMEVGYNLPKQKRRKLSKPGAVDIDSHADTASSPKSVASTPTRSEQRSPSWQQQLLTAAVEGSGSDQDSTLVKASSPAVTTPQRDEIYPSTPVKLQHQPSSDSFAPDSQMSPVSSFAAKSSRSQSISPTTSPAEPYPGSTMATAKKPTAVGKTKTPRKMMKLNAQGKLITPPAKLASPKRNATPRRKKRDKQLVVTLKYGKDQATMSSTGNKIEAILNSTGNNNPGEPSNSIKQPSFKGPPKPTHPFFLNQQRHESSIENAGLDKGLRGRADVVTERENQSRPGPKLHSITPKKFCVAPSVDSEGFGKRPMSPQKSRSTKFPGACEPLLPPKDMFHVRGFSENQTSPVTPNINAIFNEQDILSMRPQKKLKAAAIQVPRDEDVLELQLARLRISQSKQVLAHENLLLHEPQPLTSLRLPERLVTSGRDIQSLLHRELRHPSLSQLSKRALGAKEGQPEQVDRAMVHPALVHIYRTIKDSLTPFDNATYEVQQWVHKYAPKAAEHVLQPGKEALLLQAWLRRLVVTSVDTKGDGQPPLPRDATSKRGGGDKEDARSKRKRRKQKKETLEGFVISSDEDAGDMDELTDPEDVDSSPGTGAFTKKSVVRSNNSFIASKSSEKATNAIVISGPHGCGKTAAAYAVAKELDFEVFELSPGGRRSGKDILERVGDMTRNHLVHNAKVEPQDFGLKGGSQRPADNIDPGDGSGGQATWQGYLKSRSSVVSKSSRDKSKASPRVAASTEKDTKHSRSSRKQSLILLEEADVLFEEDKQFWVTVLALISQSKRPIIITCSDENLIPLDSLPLHAILRFVPPSIELAVEYLLLVAANEGHLLCRNAVEALYKSRRFDLRASLNEIDFWCQMAIGDRKGGLDWIYQRWPPGQDVNERGETYRVVSKDTYQAGMGLTGFDSAQKAVDDFEAEEELMVEAWQFWGIDTLTWHTDEKFNDWMEGMAMSDFEDNAARRTQLLAYDSFMDALSAGDVYAGRGLSSDLQTPIDPTQPALPERSRSDYTSEYQLLQVDPLIDFTDQIPHLGFATSLFSRNYLHKMLQSVAPTRIPPYRPLDPSTLKDKILSTRTPAVHLSRPALCLAFDPLATPSKHLLSNTPITGLEMSAFDRPLSVLVTDLAPYVRTVIAHDVALDQKRQQLSNLLSVNGGAKRMRMTRASRSAWEGGSRGSIRRERWWDAKVNPVLVARTGGAGWQEALREEMTTGEGVGAKEEGEEARKGSDESDGTDDE